MIYINNTRLMIIRNTKEFLKLTFKKKLVYLDFGKKKTGIAISDHLSFNGNATKKS